eukprot:3696333-Alexandrium_andersonii.AAC.1
MGILPIQRQTSVHRPLTRRSSGFTLAGPLTSSPPSARASSVVHMLHISPKPPRGIKATASPCLLSRG